MYPNPDSLIEYPLLFLSSVKSRLFLPFWYWLTWVVLDKGPLNRCICCRLPGVPFTRKMNFPHLLCEIEKIKYIAKIKMLVKIRSGWFNILPILAHRIPAMLSWRQQQASQEKLVVLRKHRQRIKSEANWKLFYYQFNRDHSKPNLIWNFKVKRYMSNI